MPVLNDVSLVACSCGQIIHEIDVISCHGCGDVTCYECTTDCIHCGKMYCIHCSENNAECIKCHLDTPQVVNKAYLVIDGERTPIKNSHFMIEKTSISNARELILKLDGRTFQYAYRSLCQQSNSNKYDYFIHFEEIIEVQPYEPINIDEYVEVFGDQMPF